MVNWRLGTRYLLTTEAETKKLQISQREVIKWGSIRIAFIQLQPNVIPSLFLWQSEEIINLVIIFAYILSNHNKFISGIPFNFLKFWKQRKYLISPFSFFLQERRYAFDFFYSLKKPSESLPTTQPSHLSDHCS